MPQLIGLPEKELFVMKKMVAEGAKVEECIARFPDSTPDSIRENFVWLQKKVADELTAAKAEKTEKAKGK